jgi:fibronectin type 3 domain-containing protein
MGVPGLPGATGAAGPVGAAGSTLHIGIGAPAATLGADGDSYIDPSSGSVYLHSGGVWVLEGNITGPTGPAGAPGASVTITTLPATSAMAAGDLVGVSQGGADHAITYANFIDGETVDAVQPAAAARDTDVVLVGQGASIILAQPMAAIWSWIAAKLPTYRAPVLELTANTALDVTTHNGRILICSLPLTLTANLPAMGSGFTCDVINLSSGVVTLSGIQTTSGGSVVPVGQSARILTGTYSGGTIALAQISAAQSTAVPGQVTGVTIGAVTSASLAVSWTAPAGAPPTSYVVQYRPTGTSAWSQIAASGTSATVQPLAANSRYDIEVMALNAAGVGAASVLVQGTTGGAPLLAPAQVTGLTGAAASATSIALSWTTVSGATGYTVRFRLTGTTPWTTFTSGLSAASCTVTGLTAGTSYDFEVEASNTAGLGSYSAVTTISTGAVVPGQVTGVTTGSETESSTAVSWTAPSGSPSSYTVAYGLHGGSLSQSVTATGTSATLSGLSAGTAYDITVTATNSAGSGPASSVVTDSTTAAAQTVTITPGALWPAPGGPFTPGSGTVGINANVSPAGGFASVRFGLSLTTTAVPTDWGTGLQVSGTLYGWYLPIPNAAGSYYIWVQALDASGNVLGQLISSTASVVVQ